MKVLNTLLFLCATLARSYALECYVGASAATATTTSTCTGGGENNCQSPVWTSYVGYAGTGAFACTATDCTAGTDCVDCVPKGVDGCNKPKESTEFNCYQWTYDGQTSTWTQKEEANVCKKTAEEEVVCNAPDRNTADASTYTISAGGCGPCRSDDQKGDTCLECYSDLCNGSAFMSVSILLAALCAVVYLV